MGWTQTYDAGPTKPFLISEMEQAGHDGVVLYRVLAYARVGEAAYMAVECLTDFPYGKGKVFATVTLVHRGRDGSITTKDMTETMGPNEDRCPARILDRLSSIEELGEPSDGYAAEWRARCRAYLAKPKPKAGQTVRFASPVRFTNGDELREMTYQKGSTFRAGHTLYRVTGWQALAFEVLA